MLEADHDDLAFCRRVGLLIIGYEVNMQTVLPATFTLPSLKLLKVNLPGNNSVRPLTFYAAASFEGVIRECETNIHLFRQGRRVTTTVSSGRNFHGVDSLFLYLR